MSTLTIDVTTDAAAAAVEMDALASSARDVGAAVDQAGAQVESGAGKIDAATASADNLDSKSSALTGSLGALAAGMTLVGAEEYAGALEGAAMATDFLSGVGGLLSLALEAQSVQWVIQKAAMVGSAVAQGAVTVATTAQTAAQWALNAALTANPIGLIVLAIAALVAGLVLAYKNSETFREVVDGAMSRAKVVIEAAVDAVQAIVGWFRDLPGITREAWEAVKQAVGDKIDDAIGFVDDLVEAVKTKPGEAVDFVKGSFESMFSPITTAIGWVDELIAKIKSIDFPDLNPLGRVGEVFGRSTRTDGLPGGGTGSGTTITIPLTVQGAIDPDGTARTVVDTLTRYFGRNPDFGGVTFGG